MPTNNGLDIHPKYNPVINWDAIPNYDLMSVKCSEGRTLTPGTQEYFKNFREQFKKRDGKGFKRRLAYHWVRSDSKPKEQIDTVSRWWDAVGGMQKGEAFQIDWETTPGLPNISLAWFEEFYGLAQDRFHNRTVTYGAEWVPNWVTWRNTPTGKLAPCWYAYYGTSDVKPKKWNADIWQYTSSTTGIPGFAPTTRLDCNQVMNWTTLNSITQYEIVVYKPSKPYPGGKLFTVFQPQDSDAEFFGMSDDHGNCPYVRWIETADDQRRRDAYIANGAFVDTAPRATNGGFSNCILLGNIPVGDSKKYWSKSDFWQVRPEG